MKKLLKLTLGLAVLISVFYVGFSFTLTKSSAKALLFNSQNSIATWVDKGTIQVTKQGNSVKFTDSNPADSQHEFVYTDGCGVNKITIAVNPIPTSGDTKATIKYYSTDPTGMSSSALIDQKGATGCKENTISANQGTFVVKNSENSNKTTASSTTSNSNSDSTINPYSKSSFSWKNGGQITSTNPSSVFTATSTVTQEFTSNSLTSGESACYNQISDISTDYKTGWIKIRTTSPTSNDCIERNTYKITINNVSNQKKTAVYADEQQGGISNDEQCEAAIEMGWIVCPLARTADSFASWLQGIIVSLLRINDSQSAYGDIQAGWSQIRIVSSAVIVVIALIMIASQIFSFEFMSAYTMKKVLPRLVIAAILIQLSWFIFTTMISLVNALGDGVQAILLTPFPALAEAASKGDTLQFILTTFSKSTGGGEVPLGIALLMGGAVAGFAAMGGLAGLGLAAIGVIIACLVAFVTLVLRKVLILALLLMAPLALAAWILPGTQKWWERWWGMFSKLLFMYPLVIGLITVGQIGAYLAAQSSGFVAPASINPFFADIQPSDMVVFFIILIAYFGPFFFIPSMFKLGGTLLARTNGAMQNIGGKWGKQAGEAGKNKFTGWAANQYGSNKAKNAFARAATGNMAPGRTRRARTAALGLKYSQERDNEVNTLVASQLAGKSWDDQTKQLLKMAEGSDIKIADAAIKELGRTGRWADVGKQEIRARVIGLAQRNSDFSKNLADNRIDIAAPGAIAGKSAAKIVTQHDSFWSSPEASNVPQGVIDQIANNPNLRDQLGSAGSAHVFGRAATGSTQNSSSSPTQNGWTGQVISPQIQRNPSVSSTVNQTAPYTTQDLEAMNYGLLQTFVANAGGVQGLHDNDLNNLHAATSNKTDTESMRLHQELQNEINRRNP